MGAAARTIRSAGAAAIVTVAATLTPPRAQYTLNDTVQNEGRAAYAAANPAQGGRGGGRGGRGAGGGAAPLTVTVTPAVAAALLGKPVDGAARGDKGGSATIDVHVDERPAPTRNVVAHHSGHRSEAEEVSTS